MEPYQPGEDRTKWMNKLAEEFNLLKMDVEKRLSDLETGEGIQVAKDRAQETTLENQSIRQEWSAGHKELKGWKPMADGDKFWVNPDGFSVKRDQVPQEVLDKWNQEEHAKD